MSEGFTAPCVSEEILPSLPLTKVKVMKGPSSHRKCFDLPTCQWLLFWCLTTTTVPTHTASLYNYTQEPTHVNISEMKPPQILYFLVTIHPSNYIDDDLSDVNFISCEHDCLCPKVLKEPHLKTSTVWNPWFQVNTFKLKPASDLNSWPAPNIS